MAEAWVRLPLSVLQNEKLSHAATTILAVLLDKRKPGTDTATISRADIAAISNYSTRTVTRSIKELIIAGYVTDVFTETGPHDRSRTYELKPILPDKKRRNNNELHITSSKE